MPLTPLPAFDPGRVGRWLAAVAAVVALAILAGCASTGHSLVSARFCEKSRIHNASEQDRLLRYAAIVRAELQASGEDVALISRTGITRVESASFGPTITRRLSASSFTT